MEGEIAFTQSTVKGKTNGSRAATVENIEEYGVSCSLYPAGQSYTSSVCGSYFLDVTVEKDGRSGYYWPGEKYNLSFFAYYPCNKDFLSLFTDPNECGMPQYTYNVPGDVREQVDFLTCNILDHEGYSFNPVPLKFRHKCTELRFSAVNKSSQNIKISSVSVVGIKTNGRLVEDSWVLGNETNSIDSNPVFLNPEMTLAPAESADITGTENHFIILPQTVRKNTEMIIVKTVENDKEYSYSYVLPQNQTFYEGESYNYRFSLGPGNMEVTAVDVIPWTDEETMNGNLEFVIPLEKTPVDLGLPSGLKWAAANLGAEKETDAGLYFAWGETVGYTIDSGHIFNRDNYMYGPAFFYKNNLTLEQDAAHVRLGGAWRMPNNDEFEELIANTSQRWVVNYNNSGENGYIFKSTVNDNQIFLPVNGSFNITIFSSSVAHYWSSTYGDNQIAGAIRFHDSMIKILFPLRTMGGGIRAVRN